MYNYIFGYIIIYVEMVMDADSDLGGKFSDESGNFFTIIPTTTKTKYTE